MITNFKVFEVTLKSILKGNGKYEKIASGSKINKYLYFI